MTSEPSALARLSVLPDVCDRAVDAGETPGGVFLAGVGAEVVTKLAFGNRSVAPCRESATLDTIYDLASLTKPIATATLVMQAVEEGRLNLIEPIGRWLPDVEPTPLGTLTPRDLLLHVSGLPAGCPMPPGDIEPRDVVRAIAELGQDRPAAEAFVYSDLGFHLLADIVERAFDDCSFADLARSRVLKPLGMNDTDFGVGRADMARCAPTEAVDGVWLRGTVHDPVAQQLGGVAGHAGLFGTASDLAVYCRMILGRGECDGTRVMAPATVDLMTEPVPLPGGVLRSMGWDVDTYYSSPRGDVMPRRGVGHTGFTGTSIWIDPTSGLYMILLTNRVHPDCSGDVVRLRRVVANVTAAAVLG